MNLLKLTFTLLLSLVSSASPSDMRSEMQTLASIISTVSVNNHTAVLEHIYQRKLKLTEGSKGEEDLSGILDEFEHLITLAKDVMVTDSAMSSISVRVMK